ncbi:putative Zinc finger, FYVE/PHD-type, Zinc finger, RING/FYVE/PHD-type, Chromo-like domain superfamily [Plasmopara halstedii]
MSKPGVQVARRSSAFHKKDNFTGKFWERISLDSTSKTRAPGTRPSLCMGRTFKGKATKTAQQKRRKKSGLGAGGSSPALSATSSTGSASTPGHRDCEQCGNSLLLEGIAKSWPVSKRNMVSTNCQICEFVAFRRSQRPCVECTHPGCDHFCEWCGKGFHAKCAKLHNEDVSSPNGFCCHKCEAEQSDDHTTDEEETKRKGIDDDVGSRCGSCRLPFSMAGKDVDDQKITTGFKVNQAVLVDNDEVLYNALITEVDTCGERIKIHFTRWSKSFDDWYAMDDEHINESLACDCCNQWFHIGCLPPIKSSGRWKDSTYVCPRCIDDARAFHNGNRCVTKAKSAFVSLSNSNAKVSKKHLSPQERDITSVGIEANEDIEEDVKTANQLRKRRKLSEGAGCSVKDLHSDSMSITIVSDTEDPLHDSKREKLSPSKIFTEIFERNNENKGKQTTTPSVASNAIARENIMALMHASPEHTIKVATEAHSSPSKSVSAKIGAGNVSAMGDDNNDKKKTVKNESGAHYLNRYSSCNTVMSLLNSPPADGTPEKDFKPSLLSLPMLNPTGSQTSPTSSSTPSLATSNFQVFVKMEHKNGQSPLCSSSVLDLSSVQAMKKEVSIALTKPTKTRMSRKTKQSQGGATSCRGLSAFDILREVASQEIDEGGSIVKFKGEKRHSVSRASAAGVHKRARMDELVNTSNAVALPGCSVAAGGLSHHSATVETSPLQQTRDRIQMNSFVDLHFSIRKEMYLRFCRLEEEGMLTRDSAHVLRSLIYPTSERFQDLKFVYLVNKDLSSVQLTKRLLEAVPYPPTVAKPIAASVSLAASSIQSPLGCKSLGLPVSMGMFSAGLSDSSPPEASRVSLLRSSSGGAAIRIPSNSRPDDSSRLASGRTCIVQSPRSSTCPTVAPMTSSKRPEMLLMEQIMPNHHPVSSQPQPLQQQQQQLLNSR